MRLQLVNKTAEVGSSFRAPGGTVSLREILLLFIAFMAWMGGGWAQNAKPNDLPSPPFVGRLTAGTEWRALVKPKTAAPEISKPLSPEEERKKARKEKYQPQLEGSIGNKGETILRIVFLWQGGAKTEGYVVNGVFYKMHNPNFPNFVTVIDPHGTSEADDVIDYRKTDFPELDWVDLTSFRGTESMDGRPCYLYLRVGKRLSSRHGSTGKRACRSKSTMEKT
jgi:hypothetical protein